MMELSRELIRLNTVRRIDPHVKTILASASQTALYSYNQDKESWQKTEVEGTLMVYEREAPPHFMMTIINRLNKSNFIEQLMSSCDMHVKPPYLLFRSSKSVIYGIWFSDESDVQRLAAIIRNKILSKSPNIASNILCDPAVAVASNSSGDIMSMLTKAHGEYEKQIHDEGTTNTSIKYEDKLIKSESDSNVADFFAKVGSSSNNATQAANESLKRSVSPANPVLQKLFQGAAAVGGQASVSRNASNSLSTSAPVPIPVTSQNVGSSNISPGIQRTMPMSLEELEGRIKEDLHMLHLVKEQETMQLQVGKNTENSFLLSPNAFTRAKSQSSSFCDFQNGNVTFSSTIDNSSVKTLVDECPDAVQSEIVPLTEDQLVLAFRYLLKSENFVKQLHEAYVKALNLSLKDS